MLTVTKADLADTLFNELGLNRREGKEFVELYLRENQNRAGNGAFSQIFWFWQL